MKKSSHTLTSSQALEDSRLQQNGQDSKQLSFARKKSSVKEFSRKDLGRLLPTPRAQDGPHGPARDSLGDVIRYPLSKKSETSMEQNTEEQLFLPEVSPASLSPLPGSEEAKKMTVIYGRKCAELLVKQNPVGYLQRMCLESSGWHSTRCLLIWKGKVTPQGRLLFQLVASTHHTGGIESGLLATPVGQDDNKSPGAHLRMKARMKGGPRYKPTSLQVQIAMLATPQATDIRSDLRKPGERSEKANKGGCVNLREQIAMLPTPQANEKNQYHSKDKGVALSRQIAMLPTPQEDDSSNVYPSEKRRETLVKVINMNSGKKTGMKLQPAFVEWMMGFPIGFTDLKRSETQSSHKSHYKS